MADMNRAQRRAQQKKIRKISKAKGKEMTFADAIGAKKMVEHAVRESVHDNSIKMEADILNQRFLWEAVVALNRSFGFGGARAVKFLEALDEVLQDVTQDTEAVDQQYAIEKIRQRAEQITGIPLRYIHEDEMRECRKRNQAEGVYFDEDPDL